jgi:hypothetical protein
MREEQNRNAVDVAERWADGPVPKAQRRAVTVGTVKVVDSACWTLLTASAFEAASHGSRYAAYDEITATEGTWHNSSPPAACLLAHQVELAAQACLLRDIFHYPSRTQFSVPLMALISKDRAVPRIAERIYAERRFEDLPILADALEDAGCDNPDLLSHLRGPGPHVRGCWALDLILGKE